MHPDHKAEAEHLSQTIGIIEDETRFTRELCARQGAEAKRLREASGGAYNNEWFLAEEMYALTQSKLSALLNAETKPYFSRIDFVQDGMEKKNYYIGKWGVTRNNTSVIVDWRAPVANLYYSGQVGCASFDAPKGRVEGDITLKRIFQIDGGELRSVIDADIVAQDEYLRGVLSDHADARLKDIVTTIQAEQNDIIRHDRRRAMAVQGVAGAGKTTVALHRVTWLLYTYQKSMKAENLMVIAPTPLFLNYISQVLPELGAERVIQTTYYGLAQMLCGIELPKLDDSGMLLRLTRCGEAERQRITRACAFKGSLAMRDCLQEYLRELERAVLPDMPLRIGPAIVASTQSMQKIFIEELAPYPIEARIQRLKKSVAARVRSGAAQLRTRLEGEVEKRASMARTELAEGSERRAKFMSELYALRDRKLEAVNKAEKTAAADYMKHIQKPDLLKAYRGFFAHEPPEGVDAPLWEDVCALTLERLDRGELDTLDLAPLIYMSLFLFGPARKLEIHHSIVDEAQDFSAFQFDVLRMITQNAAFTIVGDMAQGIHSYRGVKDWRVMLEEVFGRGKADLLTLETSYRNTVEIMEFAGRVAQKFPLSDGIHARPVLRHGKAPEVQRGGAAEILECARRMLGEGMKSVALVCRTPESCAALYESIHADMSALQLYTDEDSTYEGGTMVIPAHLVKGLEFDTVIVCDASREVYPLGEQDCRLLYVCFTRPLHELCVFYEGELTPLLQ